MDTCPICLEGIGENVTTTNCNHKFCNICFEELLENDKIECPLCRSIIKEYSNKGEKVRIFIKKVNVRNENRNEQINVPLITRREVQRSYFRNYVYTVLFLYTIYSYTNCSFMVYHLKDAYNRCLEENNNYTNIIDNLMNDKISVSLYEHSTNTISKMCMIPSYFYKKCFNL